MTLGLGRSKAKSAVFALLAMACFVLFPSLAFAGGHPANVCSALSKVKPDGSVRLRLRFDVLAFILEETPTEITDGPMYDLLNGPKEELQDRLDEAKNRLKRSVKIKGSGSTVGIDTITFPTVGDVHDIALADGKAMLPVMVSVDMTAQLPAGSTTISLHFPEVLGTVILTTEFPYTEPISEPVEPGANSVTLNIPTQQEVDALARSMGMGPTAQQAKPPKNKPSDKVEANANNNIKGSPTKTDNETKPDSKATTGQTEKTADASKDSSAPAADANEASPFASDRQNPADSSQVVTPSTSNSNAIPWYHSFISYIRMGFLHILPQGLDHILFVLGLFLLSKRTKDLIKQITAFTIAHSLTLALSLYGVFRLPSSIVEPLIALSIAFVAIENLYTTEMKAWRPLVVFGFGLVHGLGFAGALQDAGLAKQNFLTALVGFNLGVECGQLTVVAGALLLVGWFRSNEKYRSYVTMPASCVIAVVAIFWTVLRIFF